ncbi:tRNA dihydrouridine synthase DusB [Sulfurimonas sp. MAG313]|nr:tRNA dihydrouridine synthase DusB [Sulfurimonas sp. MAG313]MDF1881223.1 tRNA dihydrouridine synthase DusB [Sulfurimonas sp. MAG313]
MNSKLSFDKTLYVLAPLAGYTDLPFRNVVKKFGADLTVSEMVSSNALTHNSEKSMKMLEKNSIEDPYSVQIAGSDVDVVREAVEVINRQDGIDVIDLNCGCPVPKVTGGGSGSSLLRDLDQMARIIETIKKTSNKQYTSVKIRLGFSENNHVEIAKVVQDAGADFIAVHGRTRVGKFKSEVDYDAIAEVKEVLSIPVIANGDITDYEKAQWVLNHTKADGLMIGRGAIGKPWIFHQLKTGEQEVSIQLKKEIVLEHYDSMINFYGTHGVAMFRKHIHTYCKGLQGASHLRNEVNSITDIIEFRKRIEDFFNTTKQA